MLQGHEPSRRRYLADKDKQVVQQYMSEKTYTGNSEGIVGGSETKSGGAGAAVAGGVVVLGALGTVGYLYWAKKGCFAAKDAATKVPT
jgi:hypothetical protein